MSPIGLDEIMRRRIEQTLTETWLEHFEEREEPGPEPDANVRSTQRYRLDKPIRVCVAS